MAVPLEQMRLWSLEDPYLYEVKAVLSGGGAKDVVSTYFGDAQDQCHPPCPARNSLTSR